MTEGNKRLNIRDELERAANAMQSADLLLQHGYFSDAVSRLYYALFHRIKALLLSKGLEPKSHEGALTLFGTHFVKAGTFKPSDSHVFSRLMKYRQEADYSPSYSFAREDCVLFTREVEELSAKIVRYLQEKDYLEGP